MGAARKLTPPGEDGLSMLIDAQVQAQAKITAERAKAAAFLGVTQSAKGFAWRDRLEAGQQKLATTISQRHGLPELLGRMLAARGITVENVPLFLAPSIKALMPDPSTLRDMDKAAARLADAVLAKQRVAVFGDYDVDGASSSGLMKRFLDHHGVANRIYIPDRLFEGYGPNPTAIEALIKEGAQLIVTVDCGTTSFEPLAVAKKLKTDVLVIDHHQADERLPDVHAVVNPNRQDDLSGLGQLCAAGVVFLLLVATARELRKRGHYKAHPEPKLMDLLDIVALATVADVVPLTGLNRAFVTRGLQVMRARDNLGLRALFDVAGLNSAPTPYTLGFVLGPRINAGGRIGDAGLGAKLLATEDEAEATRIAAILDKLNKERKTLETQMLEEAFATADHMLTDNPELPIIVTGSETWHKGVVGLVASRLMDRFRRPTCIISWAKSGDGSAEEGTGSLRSVNGVDIGGAVREAVAAGLLIKGGGHAMAAGLTVKRNKLDALNAFLIDKVKITATAARERAGLEIDGALTPAACNNKLLDLIERAGPYGQGNPAPRFAFPAHRIKFAKIVGENHVRCTLEGGDGSRLDAIAFRAAGQPLGDLLLSGGAMPLHIVGTLKRDTWGGREKIDLTIEDAATPGK
jgi:single-stranded-DNA-specific exonuclease